MSSSGRVAACRGHLRIRWGVAALLMTVAVVGLTLPLSWILAGSDGWRPGSVVPLLLVAVGIATGVLVASAGIRRARARTKDDELVAGIERAVGLPAGRLRAQLELERETGPVDGAASVTSPPASPPALVRVGEAQLLPRLAAPIESLAGVAGVEVARVLRVAAFALVGVVGATVLLLAASPERATTAWAGLARPGQVLRPPPLPPMIVTPGDARVPRGLPVPVRVEARGRSDIVLSVDAPGYPLRHIELLVRDGVAAGEIPPIEGVTRYWIRSIERGREDRSPTFRLDPEDPLLVESFGLDIVYPAHTGLPPEHRLHPPDHLVLPAGSVLTFRGMLGGEPTSLALADADEGEEIVRFELSGAEFHARWRPVRGGDVRWTAEGDFPAGHRLPPEFRIDLVQDLPPEVTVESPHLDVAAGGRLPGTLVLPLEIRADDDWGLDWIELQVELPESVAHDRTSVDGERHVRFLTGIDLAELDLPTGSRIRVRAIAADRGVGPGIGASPWIEFRIPSPDALRREAREQVGEAAETLEGMVSDAARGESELRDRVRDRVAAGEGSGGPGGDRPATFGEEEELRRAFEEEARLRERMEELLRELQEGSRAMGHGIEDRELRGIMEELSRRLDEAASLGSDASRMTEPTSASEVTEELARAAERTQALRERLEEVLARAEAAAERAALDSAWEEARSLARDQRELATIDPNDPSVVDAQAELADRARELEDRVSALAERDATSGDSGAANPGEPGASSPTESASESALERARDALERAVGAMERAAAADAASEAAEARSALDEARQEAREADAAAFREVALELVFGALALGAGAGSGAEIPIEQARARVDGILVLSRMLVPIAVSAPELGHEIAAGLERARTDAESVVSTIERGASAEAAANGVRGALHAVAHTVLEALANGVDGSGSGGGAGGTLAQALEELADAQSALNQETASVGQEGSRSTPATAGGARIEELAGEQSAVASALAELARRPLDGRLPGTLEELAREAGDLAGALAGIEDTGRPDADIVSRQEELLQRMLGAGRSLERDGPTSERRGRAPGPVIRPVVPAIPEELARSRALTVPDAGALAGLAPAERRLVLEYFQRLNRERR